MDRDSDGLVIERQGNRHSLTVLSVEKDHFGVYACHAANAYGADSKKIEVSDDCKVGDWKAWGDCSATCGGGTKTRAREVIREAMDEGKTCPNLEESEVCNTDKCKGLGPKFGDLASTATTTTGLNPLLTLLICLFLIYCRRCNNSCTHQGDNKHSL